MRRGTKAWLGAAAVALAVAALVGYRVAQHRRAEHHYRAAQEALQRRDFPRASWHLDECLTLRPSDPALLLLAARTARRQGEQEKASRLLRDCERVGAPAEEVQLERWLLLAQQEELTETDALLAKAAAEPAGPHTRLILEAAILARLKGLEGLFEHGFTFLSGEPAREVARTEQAVASWSEGAAGEAEQLQAIVWRARLQLLRHERLEAARVLREVLERAPDHFEARLYLVAALSNQDEGALQESAKHLEVLRRQQPANRQVQMLSVRVYRKLAQPTQAQQVLDEMLAAEPDNLFALLERGRVALDADRPKEAEAFLRRAVELAPDEPDVVLALSRCLHRVGPQSEAKHFHERYRQLESERSRLKWEELLRRRASQKATGGTSSSAKSVGSTPREVGGKDD